MKKNKVLIISVLILITLFSVSFRIPSLFASEVFDYEWHTATVLRHLIIWNEDGGFAHNFVPAVTYSGERNKHINNHSSVEVGRLGYADSEGNYYYVSYPPFAYIAPYALFKVAGVEPNIIGLRLFNLATQVLTALTIFLLLYKVTQSNFAALLGYSLYMLTAISLYVHTVNYMSDMFVQLLFALSVYLFYEIIAQRKAAHQTQAYVPLLITLALMVYTEWIGLFVCTYLFFFALWHRREAYFRPLIAMSIFVPISVLLFVVAQYASVSSVQEFITVTSDRYLNGYESSEQTMLFVHQLDAILANYGKWFGGAGVAFFLLGIAAVWSKSKKGSFQCNGPVAPLLLMLSVPVLLHHAVFFNWTAFEIHYYSVLKTAIFTSFALALTTYVLWSRDHGKLTLWIRTALVIVLVGFFGHSLSVYAQELESRVKGDSTEYCNLGKEIARRTSDDEVAFLTPVSSERFNDIISSVLILCAHKNVEIYTNKTEADKLMLKNNTTKGVLFTIDYNRAVIEFVKSERIEVGSR